MKLVKIIQRKFENFQQYILRLEIDESEYLRKFRYIFEN